MDEDGLDDLSPAEYREIAQTETFLRRRREGCGPINAAIEVGWTPAKLQKLMKDPDFAELATLAEEQALEDIEEVLHTKARGGNMKAIQIVLFNRRAHQWKDVRHIKVERNDKLDQGVVLSVKQALAEAVRSGELSVASLQPAAPEIIDVESVEVERDPGAG